MSPRDHPHKLDTQNIVHLLIVWPSWGNAFRVNARYHLPQLTSVASRTLDPVCLGLWIYLIFRDIPLQWILALTCRIRYFWRDGFSNGFIWKVNHARSRKMLSRIVIGVSMKHRLNHKFGLWNLFWYWNPKHVYLLSNRTHAHNDFTR